MLDVTCHPPIKRLPTTPSIPMSAATPQWLKLVTDTVVDLLVGTPPPPPPPPPKGWQGGSGMMALSLGGFKLELQHVYLGCVAFTGATAAALLLKHRIVQRALPTHAAKRVDDLVERIESVTEPAARSKLPRGIAAYFAKAYGCLAAAILLNVAGSRSFIRHPTAIPIVVSVAVSVVPSFLLLCLPRDMFASTYTRLALFGVSSWAQGHMLGPINYVLSDLMQPVGLLSLATTSGLIASSLLTRGAISFLLTSQTLGTCFTIIGLHHFGQLTAPNAEFINTVLTMQLIAGTAIAALHSVPRLLHASMRAAASSPTAAPRNAGDVDEYDTPAFDWLREAKLIHSVGIVGVWP